MLEEKQRQIFEICIELHKVTQRDFHFLSYLFFYEFFFSVAILKDVCFFGSLTFSNKLT